MFMRYKEYCIFYDHTFFKDYTCIISRNCVTATLKSLRELLRTCLQSSEHRHTEVFIVLIVIIHKLDNEVFKKTQ